MNMFLKTIDGSQIPMKQRLLDPIAMATQSLEANFLSGFLLPFLGTTQEQGPYWEQRVSSWS